MSRRPPLLTQEDAQCLIELAKRLWELLCQRAQGADENAARKPPLIVERGDSAPHLVKLLNHTWATFDVSDLSDEEISMLHTVCQRIADTFVDERGDLLSERNDPDDEFN